MKTVLNSLKHKASAFLLLLVIFQGKILAQDVKAEIKGEEVGSWFSQNWLWVAGIVLVLLIILFSSSSRRSSRSVTTTTNRNGDIHRTTTTQEVED
jgi:heme/copper-type cytochrome/quinol oxidase subunit 2